MLNIVYASGKKMERIYTAVGERRKSILHSTEIKFHFKSIQKHTYAQYKKSVLSTISILRKSHINALFFFCFMARASKFSTQFKY